MGPLLLSLVGCGSDGPTRVRSEVVGLLSVTDVAILNDTLVRPILYTSVRGLDSISIEEAKQKFVAVLLPAILVAKHEREMDLMKFLTLMKKSTWTTEDSSSYSRICRRYKIKDQSEARRRLLTPPNSIVIAQAAIESGWGSSRFFKDAHNVFGVWSFNEGEARIMANGNRGGRKVYVRAYADLSASVADYFDVMSRSNAFRGLRIARESTEDPFELLPYLVNYSERRGKYVTLVKSVIEQNDLTRYDRYQIHPDYLEPE